MSKIIASAAIRGAHKYVKEAERELNKLIKEKGSDYKVAYPNTAYYLPFIYAVLGLKVENLEGVGQALKEAKNLLPLLPSEKLWLPYLGDALDAGVATLIAEEIIEVLKYARGEKPGGIWLGFTDDTILRTQGIKLVDGRMPGFAACVGALPTNEEAVKLARALQEKNILVFMASSSNGKSMAEQLAEEGIEMNWDTFLVPYGKDTSAAVHALNFAARSAMTFGGLKPGNLEKAREILLYNKRRVHAFVLALGRDKGTSEDQLITDEKYATAAGAINFGFPVLSDVDLPQILPTGICTYEHVVSGIPRDTIVPKAIEVRGLEIKVTKIDIPVPYGAGFEGERVRKEQMQVQFGGKYSQAFELLRGAPMEEVEDGKIELIGADIDQAQEGSAMPLGILVQVAGRKFQEDFESVLERRIHEFISCANGIFHMGQRAIAWIRVSKEAFQKGFRLRHLGEILVAKIHDEYSRIVDKVQVKIITDEEKLKEPLEEARRVYHERDERLGGMTDEDVDTFYSCILCQSYAPNHVCIVTPQRLGLCGAYTWLDCKASHELNPHGPNEPVKKGRCLEEVKGQWEGINEYLVQKSNGNLERFNAYSIIEDPMTSCVVGETELIIDGKLAKIDEFIDENYGGEDYTQSSALTLREGLAKQEPIVALQRFPAPDNLVHLKTKAGVELVFTPNHEIAVDGQEGIEWVRADQVNAGDRLISLANLDLSSELPALIDLLPDDFRVADQDLIAHLKKHLASKLSKDIFYIMGLIASDGSITKRDRYEYRIDFINTSEKLGQEFASLYSRTFPGRKLSMRIRKSNTSEIRGRIIKPTKRCFHYYVNNPVLGYLCEYFGIRIGSRGKWNLGKMLNLPKSHIAAFLGGLFDGDGSIRIRKYQDKWEVGEGYLCIFEEKAARHLQVLLKRLGIIGNVREDRSVWKVELHGGNLFRFAYTISSKHPQKGELLSRVCQLANEDDTKLDKTQREVLPYCVGKAIAALPASKEVLSSSTLFYYKTGRSRPIISNANKVLKANPGTNLLDPPSEEGKHQCIIEAALKTDYFLDIITKVENIKNHGKYSYVYNLTLAGTHCYFVNGGPLIKNCGCFECITVVLPETNGVMIVNREFTGMTPVGMTFSTMAGQVGGGVQTPGFIGMGKMYITSPKFISAEGGIKRVVWMPQELKEEIEERLKMRLEEIGEVDLMDKIATEKEATTSEELMKFLQDKKHPALAMEPIM
jgi:acetyl-CoA synthase